jgi:flavin-binding protein dodecin
MNLKPLVDTSQDKVTSLIANAMNEASETIKQQDRLSP